MRKKLTPRILTLTSSASTSAHADCSGTTTTAKTIVLRSDFQNVASWKRRTKLSMPMNSAGRGEMSRALVNASPKVSPIGMSRNVMQQDRRRRSMSSAVVVDEREPDTGFLLRVAMAEASSAAVMVVMAVTHWK